MLGNTQSITCAFCLAAGAPHPLYRHLELCGVAFINLYYIKKSRNVQEKLRKKRKKVGEGVLLPGALAAPVGVDACIDPRADASIRPYKSASYLSKQKPPRAVKHGAVRFIQLRISPGSPRSRW